MLVDDPLQLLVDLVPLRKKFVQLRLAKDAPQRRLAICEVANR